MIIARRGLGFTDQRTAAVLDCIKRSTRGYSVPAGLSAEIMGLSTKFKPTIVGTPSHQGVMLANRGMEITKGMVDAGIILRAPQCHVRWHRPRRDPAVPRNGATRQPIGSGER